MSEEKFYWSPVAEYLGVCISERGGDKPKTWQERTYSTDGLTYITRRMQPNSNEVEVVGFDTELEAKEYIDDLKPEERLKFFNMIDFWKVLLKKNVTAFPKYEWNQLIGGFSEVKGAIDGQNRIKDVKNILVIEKRNK